MANANATSMLRNRDAAMERAGMACYAPRMILSKGVWAGDNPLDFSVPLFFIQLLVVSCLSRLIHMLFKPFRQPRALSEFLCGILLGPAVLGRTTMITDTLFPLRSIAVYDTMANIGLVYNLFLVGVEMDIFHSFRIEKRAMAVASTGLILPFTISCFSSYLLRKSLPQGLEQANYIIFLSLAASASAFQLLARILVELKILHTEIGRLAMQSSFINDVFSWGAVVIFAVMAENKTVDANPIWVVLCSSAFVLFCIFVIRPVIWFLIRKTPEGESFSEFSICLIIGGVMISGFISEAIGMHAMFGAFIFGLVIPSGPLVTVIIEKLEDIVTGILLPLYHASSGLKARINERDNAFHWALILIIVFAFVGKAIGTFLAAMYYKTPLRDAVVYGALMNAKGLIEIVILNHGLEHHIIDSTTYAYMLFATVFTIGITIPLVTMIYRPVRKLVAYRARAIDRANLETELRILVAVHSSRNVPTIVNLVEASNPTEGFPLCVYVLHLAELTGRASAMLIVHGTQEKGAAVAVNKTQAQSEHIIKEFRNLEQHSSYISVQPLTAISPYSSMHEDICNLAEDKKVAFIIIPFHKEQTVDGEMTTINPAIQMVNQRVQENAVCSVGILVDRGLSGLKHLADAQITHQIAVLFFGGADDREALAYGMRMAQHPSNSLTVIRFLPGKRAMMEIPELRHTPQKNLRPAHAEREKHLDDDYISGFRSMEAVDESLYYAETMVNNSEETVSAVKSVDNVHDLYIVGRGQGTLSVLTEGLTEWSETPELGAIGDLLVSPDFPGRVSVLVVQYYIS